LQVQLEKQKYQIATMQPSELPALQALLQEVDLSAQGVDEVLTNFIGIFKQRRLLAAGGYEDYADHALLRSIAVRKSHQNRKLGTWLVQTLLQQLRHRSYQHAISLKR